MQEHVNEQLYKLNPLGVVFLVGVLKKYNFQISTYLQSLMCMLWLNVTIARNLGLKQKLNQRHFDAAIKLNHDI